MHVRKQLVLVPSLTRTDAAADQGPGTVVDHKYASKAVFHLDVTEVSGGTPTLNVSIEWYEPGSGKWLTLFSFTQATVVSNQTIWWGYPSDAEHLPGRFRANWTIAGTTPSFKFSVGGDIV